MSTHSPAVVIVGAGFGGLCIAINLIRKYEIRDFVILERESEVGGTWNVNRYPGAACDIWSHLYSYSFEQNPYWTTLYPGRDEILNYIFRIVEKYDLGKHIRFNSELKSAIWNNDTLRWDLTIGRTGPKASSNSDYPLEAGFLVSAVGLLNTPKYPTDPTFKNFSGKVLHSARWDRSYDLTGKKIAVIGTGASAVQIVPEAAKTAAKVVVFQRSPTYTAARNNIQIPKPVQHLFRFTPGILSSLRSFMMDVREASFSFVVFGHKDKIGAVKFLTSQALKKHFPNDPELQAKFTPDFDPGCKRVVSTDDYYPAFTKPNVRLETRPVASYTSTGLIIASSNENEKEEEEEFDLIVCATGFTTSSWLGNINLVGAHGRNLKTDIWKDGARAYLGVTVNSMPNFGMLYGPNTNLGHNSILLMLEAQSTYVAGLINQVVTARRQGLSLALSPRSDVVAEFNDILDAELGQTAFSDPKCDSWYKNEAGRIGTNWSRNTVEYQKLLANIVWPDYEAAGSADARALVNTSRDALVGGNGSPSIVGALKVHDHGVSGAIVDKRSGDKSSNAPAVTHIGRVVEEGVVKSATTVAVMTLVTGLLYSGSRYIRPGWL